MNSKQLRKKRVFIHEVTLRAGDKLSERYFEFDARVHEAKAWLKTQTKRKNYVVAPEQWDCQTFKFRDSGLASVFALKFL